jgi:acetyltransferase-like isoleucine patch superfamily enzyme
MLKILYNLFIFPLNAFDYLTNYLYLKLTNTQMVSFPSIAGRIVRRGRGKLIIGINLKIISSITENPVGLANRMLIYIHNEGEISIGENIGISNSLLYARQSIIIEDDVLIGGGCQILDNDFHSLQYEDRIINGDKNIVSSPILIKKGAFIGASSIILKGVTVGERSIVAAGSVVTKSIPDDEIWGGNPATFIRSLNK